MMKTRLPLHSFRINRDDLTIVFLMYVCQFILLFPDGLSHTSIQRYVRILQTGMLIISVIVILTKYFHHRYAWANVFFFVFLTISNFRVSSNFDSVVMYASRSIGIVVLYLWASKKNNILFWNCASSYFSIISLMNTVLTMLFPMGILTDISVNRSIIEYYLLGNRNQVIPFYIIGTSLAVINYNITGTHKMRGLFIYIQAVICDLIYYGSKTSLVMLFTFAVLYLLMNNVFKLSKRKRGLAFLGMSVVFAWYYALLVLDIQTMFRGIIENVLHKDITLSTRVEIWNEAMRQIRSSLLFGYGASTQRFIVFGSYAYDAHNLVLQILLMGGIVLLSCLIAIIIMAFKNWSKCNDKFKVIGLVMFITFAVGSSAEVYVFTYVFLISLIIYLLGEHNSLINKKLKNDAVL